MSDTDILPVTYNCVGLRKGGNVNSEIQIENGMLD